MATPMVSGNNRQDLTNSSNSSRISCSNSQQCSLSRPHSATIHMDSSSSSSNSNNNNRCRSQRVTSSVNNLPSNQCHKRVATTHGQQRISSKVKVSSPCQQAQIIHLRSELSQFSRRPAHLLSIRCTSNKQQYNSLNPSSPIPLRTSKHPNHRFSHGSPQQIIRSR